MKKEVEVVLKTFESQLKRIEFIDKAYYNSLVKLFITDSIRRPIVGFFTTISIINLKDHLDENSNLRDFLFDLVDIISVRLEIEETSIENLIELIVRAITSVRVYLDGVQYIAGDEIQQAIEVPEDLKGILLVNPYLVIHYVILSNMDRVNFNLENLL